MEASFPFVFGLALEVGNLVDDYFWNDGKASFTDIALRRGM